MCEKHDQAVHFMNLTGISPGGNKKSTYITILKKRASRDSKASQPTSFSGGLQLIM